jgi:hypothetical protein
MKNILFGILAVSLLITIPVRAQVLLEDFASQRKNGMGGDLWSAYLGEDPNQTYSIENGMLKLVVGSGSAPYLHFFPNTGFGYPFPQGFAQNFKKSGTWNPNINRLRFWVKCSKSVSRRSDGGDILQVGTYIKPHSSGDVAWQGAHYYHLFDPNFYANRWMMVELNRLPQHEVGNNGSATYAEDPEWSSGVHYFDGLTRFYFDTSNGSEWANQTCYFDNFEFDLKSGEPETQVSSMTATYTGSAYEVSWAAPKNVNTSYEIRYSTTSMKSAGFNSGASGGTVSSPGSAYVGTFWKSTNMPEADPLYVAIRPTNGSAFTELRIPKIPGSSGGSSNPCDLDGNSITDFSDATLSVDSAVGRRSCTADLNSDGICDVVDAQRVINASLGSTCRVGP